MSHSSRTTSKGLHDTIKKGLDEKHASTLTTTARRVHVESQSIALVLANMKGQCTAGLPCRSRPFPLKMSEVDASLPPPPPSSSITTSSQQARKPVFAHHHNIFHDNNSNHQHDNNNNHVVKTGAGDIPSIKVVNALYRRIVDLETENQRLRESLAKMSSSAATVGEEGDDDGLGGEEQHQQEGVTSRRHVLVGEDKSDCSSSALQHHSSNSSSALYHEPSLPGCPPPLTTSSSAPATAPGQDVPLKVQRKTTRPSRYPLGISRYSWPPGSPNSSFSRCIAEALEELISKSAGEAGGAGGGGARANGSSCGRAESPAPASKAPPLNFTEFSVVGVKAAILKGEEVPRHNEQPLEVLERASAIEEEERESYFSNRGSGGSPPPPSLSLASLPSTIEKLADFCFPRGCRLELAQSSELELCTGRHRDQTHVLQFTDSQGATSYGVCITVYEPRSDCPPSLVEALKQIRREHAAARTIQQFVRSCYAVEEVADAISGLGEMMGGENRRELVDDGDVGWVRKGGLFSQVRNRMKRLQLSGGGWGTPTNRRKCPERIALTRQGSSRGEGTPRFSRTCGGESDVLDEYQRLVSEKEPRSRLNTAKLKQSEDENDLVVVAPRCFCLMSQQPNHPVLYKLLQLMVERERAQVGKRRLGGKAVSSLKRRHSCNTFSSSPPLVPSLGQALVFSSLPVSLTASSPSPVFGSSPPVNNSLLLDMYLADKPVIESPVHSDLSTLRKRFLRHVKTEVTFPAANSVTISFPLYSSGTTRLDFPLVPLQDWTVAVLFSRISADVIVKCVNILLLEQSLVIVGEDFGLVSAIGTALTSLLAPFKWDGVFIPVLPAGLSDILQSPVPYVLGVAPPFDPSRVPNTAILYIGQYKEHLRVPQMETKLPLCYQHLQELREAGKIFLGRRSRWANLHLSTYMSGLTPDETKAITSLRQLCQSYVEGLCGDLKYGDAWRKYGAFNSTTHDFEFYPGWFLAPLQMMLDFQSTIVHTQMFHSYIDKRQAEDLKAHQHRLRCQAFIGLFVSFKYRQRRARRQREQASVASFDCLASEGATSMTIDSQGVSRTTSRRRIEEEDIVV